MPPAKRRAAIVAAALPLLEEHGPDLTTRMVAEAAGVAEGTLFRAFPTLGDLLEATYADYLSADRLRARLADVDLGESLEDHTRGALTALAAYFSSVHVALRSPRPGADHRAHVQAGHQCYRERFVDLREWLEATFARFQPELDLPVATFAHFLTTLAIGHVMGRTSTISIDDVTRFALDGAARKDRR